MEFCLPPLKGFLKILPPPLITELKADSFFTSLSLNKNKSIGVVSSASIPVLDARNKSEVTNFSSLLLTSSSATMSNVSTTSLCNYKSLLKYNMNLVDSKLNGFSIMSPPAFTINTANQSTVSSLQSKVAQEGHIASTGIGRRELTYGRNNSNTHVLEAAPNPQNCLMSFLKILLKPINPFIETIFYCLGALTEYSTVNIIMW